jgi:hypothetical protein
VVGDDGRLAQAIVSLVPLEGQDLGGVPPPQVPGAASGPAEERAEEDADTVVVSVADGELSPRVQVVRKDQTIVIDSRDAQVRIQGTTGNWSFGTSARKGRLDLGARFGDLLWNALNRGKRLKIWSSDAGPGAAAWVVLVEAGEHRVTARDGRFRFDGVPGGRYRVDVWHEQGASTQEITVDPSVPAQLELDLR